MLTFAGTTRDHNDGAAVVTLRYEAYPEMAQKHRAILIPFILEGVAANPTLNLPDGIHPTAEGYRVVTDLVYPRMLEAIARVRSARAR